MHIVFQTTYRSRLQMNGNANKFTIVHNILVEPQHNMKKISNCGTTVHESNYTSVLKIGTVEHFYFLVINPCISHGNLNWRKTGGFQCFTVIMKKFLISFLILPLFSNPFGCLSCYFANLLKFNFVRNYPLSQFWRTILHRGLWWRGGGRKEVGW